jgi:hypothetical protein
VFDVGAWVLVKGLLVQISNTSQITDKRVMIDEPSSGTKSMEDKASSHSLQDELHSGASGSDQQKKNHPLQHSMDFAKAKHGFSVLSVALGSQALTRTSMLLEDLSSEMKGN